MKKILFLSASLLYFGWLAAQVVSASDNKSPADEAQSAIEKTFDESLSTEYIGQMIRQLSYKPHHLGSPAGKEVADSILTAFRRYGWEANLNVYKVLFPTPKIRILELISPTKYKAVLREPAVKETYPSEEADGLPPYNAWSPDGDVTAPLIFVNYGLPADYEMLDRMGISVKGKIVIAKYGRSWRGIKPKIAQERGAVGCIIYSDPGDDGFAAGEVYPIGPYKNEFAVQRGSVMDLPVHPGDPITPGTGATENALRIDKKDATNLLKIPVLPISYHDAGPLLKSLRGRVVPAGWQGGLPFTYHIGDGTATVHLKLSFNWDLVPCYNVIATLRGTVYPDEWVVRGNHHDAWVNGANDPVSGVAALLAEAKALGELLKTGWKPKRTIVYCAWDGEEPALLGSTEYVEDNLKELQEKAVVYINSDGNGRGFLHAGGSHALENFVNEVAGGITDPQTNVSVLQRVLARNAINTVGAEARKKAMGKHRLELSALGSGSDFTPFLQFAGIPSLNIAFGGEDGSGEYHTRYDTYDNFRRFIDPGFHYGKVLAQTIGHSVLRLANADILPFRYGSLSKTIETYGLQVANLLKTMREDTQTDNVVKNQNLYAVTTDTAKHINAPLVHSPVPFLDFSSLENALASFNTTADSLDAFLKTQPKDANSTEKINRVLYTAEQQLLLPQGLPGRPWYKHCIYAPGLYTGYGVKTLPEIREAIEQRDWSEAQQGINNAAAAITRLREHLQTILN